MNDTVGDPRVRQQVTGFNGQYFSNADLQVFEAKHAPWALGQRISAENVIGPNNQTRGAAGLEASLDVQTITALG